MYENKINKYNNTGEFYGFISNSYSYGQSLIWSSKEGEK